MKQTVLSLTELLEAEPLSLPDEGREIDGVYCGDLLSWVMGHAKSDNVWVTVMTNLNVIAVATLTDVACVVVTDASEIPDETLTAAKAKNINLLRTALSSYEVCARLSRALTQKP